MISGSYSLPHEEASVQSFITKVYAWMFLGLVLTGYVALQTVSSGFLNMLAQNTGLFYGVILLPVGLVLLLSFFINKISAMVASIVFVIYSAVNGISLAVIFLIYTQSSIASTFFVTAGVFGLMSLYGFVTKKDLTSMGSLLRMALLGLILASVVNLFLGSSLMYWGITYVGIIIFVGLVAYDTQKLKMMARNVEADSESGNKAAVIGALALYLDFINLFLLLLRLMGRRRD